MTATIEKLDFKLLAALDKLRRTKKAKSEAATT